MDEEMRFPLAMPAQGSRSAVEQSKARKLVRRGHYSL